MVSIMIVEDVPELAELLQIMLERKEFTVPCVSHDGREALKLYQELGPKPDLVILDHRIPHKLGLEVGKEIRSINPVQKILFLTADKSIQGQLEDHNFCNYLFKPVSFDQIFLTITNLFTS